MSIRSPERLTAGQKRKLTFLRADLLDWASENGRSFPWRSHDAGTYQRIAVEVLLQRTTASAVAGIYRDFFERFPSWHHLAVVEPDLLEAYLKPLGLWRRRAKSLLGLARYASANAGQFPANPLEHKSIPAVGQYVSNAILIFQHGRPAPLLDGNMARVIERFVRPRRLADLRYDPWLQAAAHWLTREENSVRASWAVLDFAATICRARAPHCTTCPVATRCSFPFNATKGSRGKRNG